MLRRVTGWWWLNLQWYSLDLQLILFGGKAKSFGQTSCCHQHPINCNFGLNWIATTRHSRGYSMNSTIQSPRSQSAPCYAVTTFHFTNFARDVCGGVWHRVAADPRQLLQKKHTEFEHVHQSSPGFGALKRLGHLKLMRGAGHDQHIPTSSWTWRDRPGWLGANFRSVVKKNIWRGKITKNQWFQVQWPGNQGVWSPISTNINHYQPTSTIINQPRPIWTTYLSSSHWEVVGRFIISPQEMPPVPPWRLMMMKNPWISWTSRWGWWYGWWCGDGAWVAREEEEFKEEVDIIFYYYCTVNTI